VWSTPSSESAVPFDAHGNAIGRESGGCMDSLHVDWYPCVVVARAVVATLLVGRRWHSAGGSDKRLVTAGTTWIHYARDDATPQRLDGMGSTNLDSTLTPHTTAPVAQPDASAVTSSSASPNGGKSSADRRLEGCRLLHAAGTAPTTRASPTNRVDEQPIADVESVIDAGQWRLGHAHQQLRFNLGKSIQRIQHLFRVSLNIYKRWNNVFINIYRF